ncbi:MULTISPECIES: ExeM/NucH family extracellular endonuclease [unclassified Luteococcus]|uniref:ExeM/NucH family extracellular endonuclease n=1 Tax=unclassified Luteococcus TaxID=2639923 RepID=UPI00313B7926
MSHSISGSWRGGLTAAALGLGMVAQGLAALPAQAATDHLVIDEVYGGGGNSGAPYTHDFVELFNGTGAAIDVTGWKLNYYSAAGNPGNSCTLSGSVQPGKHFLVQQAKGTAGTQALPTPDATCTAAMSATAGSVELVDASGAVVDLVGFGTATKVETAAAPAPSNTTSISRTDGADTGNNQADFTKGEPKPENQGAVPDPTPEPTPDPTPEPTPEPTPAVEKTIAEIQGTGTATPLAGQSVTTKGVVTASYPTGGFNGFYLQTPGSGGSAKAAGQASDGIFVYTGAAPTVKPGECYAVTGVPAEYNTLTQLTKPVLTPATDCAEVKPTELATLPQTDADKEAYEGMLVQPLGNYTITNNYNLNNYGQVGLAAGDKPLWTATDRVVPAEAAAYEAEQAKKYITLDDGSSWDYLRNTTAQKSPLPYLSQGEPMRTDSKVTFTKPVILDYRFQWNYQPVEQIVGATDDNDPLTTQNTRPTAAPAVGGELKLGAMNVLNYFTDLGQDEAGCSAYKDMSGNPVTANGCTVRGAYTPAALKDQQTKIIAALEMLDADVVGLMEIENAARFGHDRDAALKTLVDALNAKVGAGTYDYVRSPVARPVSEDVIRTAFIYKSSKVKPVDASVILDSPAFANARQPLGQKFESLTSGKTFVAVANHFKSKGSGVDDGTGQGNSNPSREEQARDVTAWTKQLWPDEAVFMVGDFNAYSRETPVQIIEAAGFTNLVRKFSPESTSYQFGGRLGSLDHAFANEKALAMVTGADDLNINGDESVAMQYSRRHYNITDFYAPTPYASSDHDPVLVGLSDAKPAPKTPVITPSQNCESFGFKATDFVAGDKLRIDGHWNGQAQYTTVELTDAGWWSGPKPSWTDATAVVVRDGKALEQTRVSITKEASCTPPVIAGKAEKKSFSFSVRDSQPGDQLRVSAVWKGREQTFTVPAADGYQSPRQPSWQTASAVIVRDGKVMAETRVEIKNPAK